jgi:hypothetical protein
MLTYIVCITYIHLSNVCPLMVQEDHVVILFLVFLGNLYPSRKQTIPNAGKDVGGKGTLINCGWKCKVV